MRACTLALVAAVGLLAASCKHDASHKPVTSADAASPATSSGASAPPPAVRSVAAPAPTASAPMIPAVPGYRWKNMGVDPFAQTRVQAMADRERVFRQDFGLSPTCVNEALRVTNIPGRKEHLNVGDRLKTMVSKNHKVHRDVEVAFPPVRRGVNYAAPIEVWEFECDGKNYKIGLPEVCYNWSEYYPARQQTVAPVVGGPCPNGWTLEHQVRSLRRVQELHPELHRKLAALIEEAKRRETLPRQGGINLEAFKSAGTVSRHGAELRRLVPELAPVSGEVSMQYLDARGQPTVSLGTTRISGGLGSTVLRDDPRRHTTKTVWPNHLNSPTGTVRVESPVVANVDGLRQLLVFGEEWRGCLAIQHSLTE